MPSVPDAVAIRGEWLSLLIVAVALWWSARPLSELLRLPNEELGDLFWYGGLAFVGVGRLGYVALESPEALTDPLVLIRIQGGIEPLLGLLGVLGVLAWRTRREPALRLTWLAAASGGLVAAAIGYDVACLGRDACFGATAPAPFGFAMSGLSETRVATPLIEAALLLLMSGAVLSSGVASSVRRGLIALGGIATLIRVALTPLSVLGTEALGLESVVFAVLGVGALVVAWRDDGSEPTAVRPETATEG
jgi:hypothetical protein